jgi:acyl-CoA thioester hydrolase
MPKFFETTIRVRFADTDADGGVFHANYITYFSIGRHDYLREMGIGLRQMELEEDLRMAVVEVRCTFKAGARFDDILRVRTSSEKLGNKSMTFLYEVIRGETDGSETLIATGNTVQCFIDRAGAAVVIPDRVRQALSD